MYVKVGLRDQIMYKRYSKLLKYAHLDTLRLPNV